MNRFIALLTLALLPVAVADAAVAEQKPFGGWALFGQSAKSQAAQASAEEAAIRVNQLEEQVRVLNGKIEDLNFTILQLQETLRKMQEDNEFRFQEIEGKRGGVRRSEDSVAAIRRQPDAGGAANLEPPAVESGQAGQSAETGPNQDVVALGEQGQSGVRTIDGVEVFDGTPGQQEPGGSQNLGRMVFDANGNLVDTAIEKPLELAPPPGGQVQQQQERAEIQRQQASLSPDPAKAADQAYDLGYTYVQAGDYRHAANSFREFVRSYPKHAKIAEANFWLGESLLAMKQYDEAAKVLLDTHKRYPKSRLAPQTLLKLGVSLVGMNQRELGCATFAEVAKQYPNASESVRSKVAQEQKAANCTAS